MNEWMNAWMNEWMNDEGAIMSRDWRDGSEVKNIGCSSKGPEFNSQQPHSGSHPSKIRSGAYF